MLLTIQCELIDTLWNVNRSDFLSGLNVSGINRYIMECKWIQIIF